MDDKIKAEKKEVAEAKAKVAAAAKAKTTSASVPVGMVLQTAVAATTVGKANGLSLDGGAAIGTLSSAGPMLLAAFVVAVTIALVVRWQASSVAPGGSGGDEGVSQEWSAEEHPRSLLVRPEELTEVKERLLQTMFGEVTSLSDRLDGLQRRLQEIEATVCGGPRDIQQAVDSGDRQMSDHLDSHAKRLEIQEGRVLQLNRRLGFGLTSQGRPATGLCKQVEQLKVDRNEMLSLRQHDQTNVSVAGPTARTPRSGDEGLEKATESEGHTYGYTENPRFVTPMNRQKTKVGGPGDSKDCRGSIEAKSVQVVSTGTANTDTDVASGKRLSGAAKAQAESLVVCATRDWSERRCSFTEGSFTA